MPFLFADEAWLECGFCLRASMSFFFQARQSAHAATLHVGALVLIRVRGLTVSVSVLPLRGMPVRLVQQPG